MFHREHPIHFDCTGCGACCVGGPEDYVALLEGEAEAIAGFLQIDLATLKRRALCKLTDQHLGVRLGEDGRCLFLRVDGGCAIYPVRPQQCQTYPFWREMLASPASWAREAECCEGIGRGMARDPDEVERLLDLDRDSPVVW